MTKHYKKVINDVVLYVFNTRKMVVNIFDKVDLVFDHFGNYIPKYGEIIYDPITPMYQPFSTIGETPQFGLNVAYNYVSGYPLDVIASSDGIQIFPPAYYTLWTKYRDDDLCAYKCFYDKCKQDIDIEMSRMDEMQTTMQKFLQQLDIVLTPRLE